MFYKNNDKAALYARDMELWCPDELEIVEQTCEHCGETLNQGYYDINNSKLCENCAKLEYREYFQEFEDLEQLKQICEYDSIEQLIEETIEENLYKFWKSF